MIRILPGYEQQGKNQSSMNKMFRIHKFKKVDSTNNTAEKYPVNSVIISIEQIKGRGRFEREWISTKGGLWFSIIVKPVRKLCEYTFIASVAVFESLEEDIDNIDIKWPNDIYYKGKKLCGILTEVISTGNKIEKAIIGIGLNLNNDTPKEGVSLKEIKKDKINEEIILNKILDNFKRISDLSLTTILRKYKKNCSMLGKKTKVRTLKGTFEGTTIDIDHEGNLILKTKESILRLNEGDTSIL